MAGEESGRYNWLLIADLHDNSYRRVQMAISHSRARPAHDI